jgi:subfamily B ATP-binding cassette protein MsbA
MNDGWLPSGQYGAWSVYRRLLSYVRPYWWIFALALLGMAVDAGTQAGFAYLMKPLLDESFVKKNPDVIAIVPPLIVVIFLARGVAGFLATYGMAAVGRHVIRDLRSQMFRQYLSLPTRYYDNASSGQMISRLTYNTEQVAQAATNAVTILVRDSLTIIALLGVMLYLSVTLTLTFLVVGPVIAGVVTYVSRRFRRISRRIQDSMGDVTHVTEEVVEGNKVVKTFGGQDYEEAHFRHANENNRKLNMKMMATNAASAPLVEFAGSLALAAIVFMATRPELIAEMTPGTFVSFFSSMMLLLPAMKKLTTVNAQIQKGIAAAESIFELLDSETEADTGTHRLERAEGELEFQDVSLVYEPEKGPVLSDIGFRARPGTVTAIVGRSGSGKSSLVSLIPRFYEPDTGRILLDGTDIRDIRLRDLRDQIGLVTQDITLFNDTVARNIAYGGLGQASQAEIERAAEAAHAMEFIRHMPEGLDTMVGENGVLLSGGQRQRIAIARALLKDAPILILDEATSSLDSESERMIQDALDDLMRARTTLVIAHRLSTVENADQVVVLKEGRIAEVGSHAELLSGEGHYRWLHRMQFRDDEPGEIHAAE